MAGEKQNYQFKRISAQLLEDFARLAKNAFGVEATVEENKKLFDTCAYGSDYLGFLAYDETGETAAGFYGVFPVFVEYNGKRFLAAQSGSTMTHSEHRKKGLFYELGQKTFELARSEGVAFVYGFPNANSYRGLMKLGWTHDGNINAYHIFVPTLPLGYLGRKSKLLECLHAFLFKFVTDFRRSESRPFSSSVIEQDVGGVFRDKAFLSYKKDNDNRFMLNIGGRLVWINQRQGKLGVGDIELIDEAKDFKRVLRFLKLICFLSGTPHIVTYASAGCRLDRLFAANGYKSRKGLANCYLKLNDAAPPPENFKYVYADFDTF